MTGRRPYLQEKDRAGDRRLACAEQGAAASAVGRNHAG
jgi:hypothetical protein